MKRGATAGWGNVAPRLGREESIALLSQNHMLSDLGGLSHSVTLAGCPWSFLTKGWLGSYIRHRGGAGGREWERLWGRRECGGKGVVRGAVYYQLGRHEASA